MTKKKLKLGLDRICLILFILMCSVFTSENSYSIHYDKSYFRVEYKPKTNSIIFHFLIHLYTGIPGKDGYLESSEFWFGKNRISFKRLICVSSKNKMNNNRVSITMHDKRLDEDVSYLTAEHTDFQPKLPERRSVTVDVKTDLCETKDFKIKTATLAVRWKMSEMAGEVNYFKMVGFWRNTHRLHSDRIDEVYTLKDIKLNTNTMEYTPSELNSEVSDKVMVTCETDAVNVTGAGLGENIQVYTASGVEVKSVVANDELVNVKLPTNQIYIVKAGQKRYKVAL